MAIYVHTLPYTAIYSHICDYICLYITIYILKYVFWTLAPLLRSFSFSAALPPLAAPLHHLPAHLQVAEAVHFPKQGPTLYSTQHMLTGVRGHIYYIYYIYMAIYGYICPYIAIYGHI